MADVFRPMWVEAGSDLVLLHPNGSEDVLVAAGKTGAVADPCVSFDAKWVYYSYFPDVTAIAIAPQYVPVKGADIYKVNVETRQIVRLTHQEYTPNTGIRTDPLPYGIFNMGPCPIAGGKVVFTSNRNGFIPTKGFTPVVSQLYVMDEDGSNVQAIAPMTLGAALHPFQLKDGRVAFSSYESQGMRDSRIWAMWAIWPDGRMWEPLMSAFGKESAFHFATQLSNGDMIVEDYYNLNNNGFGTFYRFPTKEPANGVRFHPAALDQNPALPFSYRNLGKLAVRYAFSPVGISNATPFTHHIDEAAPVGPDGKYVGKVTQPSGAPNGDMLLVWTPGPANSLPRPVTTPVYDAGLYLARNGGPVESPSELVLIKNDPRYNEQWPRAVVPYKAIYGVDEPHEFPFLPNDGTAHPSLPEGTAYGIIGTSSLYKRESFPGKDTVGATYEGLDPFNAFIDGGNSNWQSQGADAGKYSNSEIAAIRIIAMEPTTEGTRQWYNHAIERLRVLGEISVRKTNTNGSPVLDPEGNPDTSFWAKVPADTPISFQMLDAQGRLLTMAQTWHQVRPGEVRTNCGGCHAHSQAPLAFSSTAAAQLPPTDLTMTPAHDVEFVRDIRPILQRACVSCHKGANPPAKLAFDSQAMVGGVPPDQPNPGLPADYAVLARNATGAHGGIKAIHPPNLFWYGLQMGSRYLRKFQSRRSLLVWKLYGARLDGWTNENWPTESVPGDPSTMPAGASGHMIDLDYSDTANHKAMISDNEKRLITTWIDLGAPIDLGGGHWQDETRPALAITVREGSFIVGASDAYSGLDASSLSVKVNGSPTTMSALGDGRWRASLATANATITARVKDRAGNWTELTRRLGTGGTVGQRRRASSPPISTVAPPLPREQGISAHSTLTLAPSKENYPNPERGFYRQLNPFDAGTRRTPLDPRALAAFRADGITLLRAYYNIDEFREVPLSRSALDGIASDLAVVRQVGIKIIPRFAYSFPCAGSLEPCSIDVSDPRNFDAPLNRVLEHLDQLAPVLRAGSDVIAFMEMGFVGAWGEWHHSSNLLINPDNRINTSSAAIVERVLWVLPDTRMAVLRYPYNKQQLFGPNPLNQEQAFSRTPQARIGAHNDCFLANNTDRGTYRAPVNLPIDQNIQTQRAYASLDTRFVPHGGETCSAGPDAVPYIGCANAMKDLALFHWTTINIEYQSQVIALWKEEGCFAEIQRRLGYRFRLIDADIPGSVKAGDAFTLGFTITNDGWAAPYNPRAVLIVLRHSRSGRIFTIPVSEDPRRWAPDEPQVVTIAATMPAEADVGDYQVLLNLPDPEPTLYSRPEYSIRLANVGLWEASTGSNVLPVGVTVTR